MHFIIAVITVFICTCFFVVFLNSYCATLKTPVRCNMFCYISYNNGVRAIYVLKIPKFSLRWHRGSVSKKILVHRT